MLFLFFFHFFLHVMRVYLTPYDLLPALVDNLQNCFLLRLVIRKWLCSIVVVMWRKNIDENCAFKVFAPFKINVYLYLFLFSNIIICEYGVRQIDLTKLKASYWYVHCNCVWVYTNLLRIRLIILLLLQQKATYLLEIYQESSQIRFEVHMF